MTKYPLEWDLEDGPKGTRSWIAGGGYVAGEDDVSFYYVIREELRDGELVFVEDSAAELMWDEFNPRVWPCLEWAKREIQKDHDVIMEQVEGELGSADDEFLTEEDFQ